MSSRRAFLADGEGDLALVSVMVHDLIARRAVWRDGFSMVHIHVPAKVPRPPELFKTNLALEEFHLVSDFEVRLITPAMGMLGGPSSQMKHIGTNLRDMKNSPSCLAKILKIPDQKCFPSWFLYCWQKIAPHLTPIWLACLAQFHVTEIRAFICMHLSSRKKKSLFQTYRTCVTRPTK